MEKTLVLQSGREKSLLRRHPWIFSGAVRKITGNPAPGEPVRVVAADGRELGIAAFSPHSQITGRIWSFDPAEVIDTEFFAVRIRRAIARRELLGFQNPDGACRLIASEADGLPGVIADRYRDFIVLQLLSAGAVHFRELLLEALRRETGAAGIYERSDAAVRKQEGLPEFAGPAAGEPPPEHILFAENGLDFAVDVRRGHKTGFYLDQRENRLAVRQMAGNRTVLNCFAYSGAFGVAALAGGAEHVTNVDSSAPALELAAANCRRNGFANYRNLTADVFARLRSFHDDGEKFDLIILDPPKFIDHRGSLPRGCRAYQDIARLGFQLLNPGGLLFTFSCSGLMPAELFQKITADAALQAGVDGQIIGRLSQSPDHPTSLAVPESFYLKGLIVVI